MTDLMCLSTDQLGLCINMSFLGIEDIQPENSFDSQGWLGFGPNRMLPEESSVALHPDENGDLVVWFDEAEPTEGLTYFFNLGEEHWSLPLTNMKFNAEDMQPEHIHGLDPMRVASLNAENSRIMLGRAQFELMASNVVDSNDAMTLKEDDGVSLLQAQANCEDFSTLG